MPHTHPIDRGRTGVGDDDRQGVRAGWACGQLGLIELDRDLVWAWAAGGFALRLVSNAASWKRLGDRKVRTAVVQDAGFTEVAPGTVTCAATFDSLG